MKLQVYNQKAEKINEIEVNDSIFSSEVSDKVLSQYNYIYLSNQRQSNANTKDKSEVRGGGKKPWNQKGTGRARAGSSRSPIWRGGGVTFGPTNEVNWKKKTTKKFRASSFRSAFSKLILENLITIVDDVQFDNTKPLTKQALDMNTNFLSELKFTSKKTLLIMPEKNGDILKAFANLKKNKVISVSELSVYDLITGGNVLVHKSSLPYIDKWSKKAKK